MHTLDRKVRIEVGTAVDPHAIADPADFVDTDFDELRSEINGSLVHADVV
jgi:hypothetical protein